MAASEGDDLFSSTIGDHLNRFAPLAARMRPKNLDEMVGQAHLVGKGKTLRALIESDRISSVILWGPPGTGKTTLANLIAYETKRNFVALSAVTAGVKDVREVTEQAREQIAMHSKGTILFLDEVHRFNRSQQDALLPAVEEGVISLIGATTENPFFSINAPLLSRSSLFRLEPLDHDSIKILIGRALDFEGSKAETEAIDLLADLVDGDARAALTSLEIAIALAADTPIQPAHIQAARDTKALRYEQDDHYDIISAFIKSIRGSDPDAGLYWLARMLEAGEDARFIARRLVILASEDIGLADSNALLIADSAARAVEFVGLPEAQLNLAHAVVYLSQAPKSNSVKQALNLAKQDVTEEPSGSVPIHLRDASYKGASAIGHGKGYKYPHDYEDGFVEQDYRPSHLQNHRYWKSND